VTQTYIVFKSEDVEGLADLGISRVTIEVSQTGDVLREVGFDGSGKAIYRFPGKCRFGERGLFDGATVSLQGVTSDLSSEEFNKFFHEIG